MVSQNTTPSSSSGILHHFIPSDPDPNNQTHLNQRLDAYISAMRSNNSFPTVPDNSEISHNGHLMDLLGTAPESGVSLTLGSQMLLSQNHHQYDQYDNHRPSYNQGLVSPHYLISSEEREHHYAYSTSSLVNSVRSSKYLKAAQSLLQEVVNISNYETCQDDFGKKLPIRGVKDVRLSSALSAELCSTNGFLSEVKHELHLKFAKLVSLLEEVENRYERYYNQMQEVVSSLELIAGAGSASCYTGLALQAMSKHFFILSNAILSEINLTKIKIYKNSPRLSSGGGSQLSLFNQDGKYMSERLTLQQIGLFHGQRNAWRPIRGLPETSVVILRAWLFEHFLHPYPTESEKLILSSQTGLSKNQVSNWFINARVRLWKPMIEEMYKEEFADSSDSDPLGTSGNGSQMAGE